MIHEKIMEASLNKSAEEIGDMYSILIQSIRNFISRNLMDTSEDNPIKCDICISYDTFVDKIFLSDDGNGYILVHLQDADPDDFVELEDLYIVEQLVIVRYLNDLR